MMGLDDGVISYQTRNICLQIRCRLQGIKERQRNETETKTKTKEKSKIIKWIEQPAMSCKNMIETCHKRLVVTRDTRLSKNIQKKGRGYPSISTFMAPHHNIMPLNQTKYNHSIAFAFLILFKKFKYIFKFF